MPHDKLSSLEFNRSYQSRNFHSPESVLQHNPPVVYEPRLAAHLCAFGASLIDPVTLVLPTPDSLAGIFVSLVLESDHYSGNRSN